MKKNILVLVTMALTSTVYADGNVELSQVTPMNVSKAIASTPVVIRTEDGARISSALAIHGEIVLSAPSVSIKERFMNISSAEEYLQSRYCGQSKNMVGEFERLDKGPVDAPVAAGSKIRTRAEVNRVAYSGADSKGTKMNSTYSCR